MLLLQYNLQWHQASQHLPQFNPFNKSSLQSSSFCHPSPSIDVQHQQNPSHPSDHKQQPAFLGRQHFFCVNICSPVRIEWVTFQLLVLGRTNVQEKGRNTSNDCAEHHVRPISSVVWSMVSPEPDTTLGITEGSTTCIF